MVRPNGTKSWIYRYKPLPYLKTNVSHWVFTQVCRLCVPVRVWRDYEELLSRNDPKDYREEEKKTLLINTNNSFNRFAWEYFDSLDQTQKNNTLIRDKGRLELI